ncbi:MAG: carboxy terminal-processing peptidase [Gemmataceae bacterium]|nr:carboxy terminal-processing peptidase [Gemmataceae bacterium]
MRFRHCVGWIAALLVLPWFVWGQTTAPSRPAIDLAKADERDKLIVTTVARVIDDIHLTGRKLDKTIAARLHDRFIEQWDPRKLFFLESDIAEFAAAKEHHAKFIAEGDLSFPVRVYEVFLKRLAERNAWTQVMAGEQFDFDKECTVFLDAKHTRWPKSTEEARQRWKDWITYELCSMKVDGVKENEARTRIQKRYKSLWQTTQSLDKDDLLERYLAAFANAFDPHSGYLSPKSLEEFDIAMRLQLQGIGALLGSEDGKTMVKEIIAGGPAADDKRLKVGDQITGVGQGEDGEIVDVVDMSLNRVVQLIRGKAGTKVRLEVIPANTGQRVIYVLTRRKITLTDKGAKSDIIETSAGDNGAKLRIGVLTVPSFYGGSDTSTGLTQDATKILTDFQAKGVDAVLIDLRYNGGGLLNEAVGLASLLVDRGPIVQVKDFQGKIRQLNDDHPGVVYDGPLVVLVNRLSASASEIFSGVIQDYRRGLIVGDSTTFGKGSVAQMIDLARLVQANLPVRDRNLGAIMVTLQAFYRVNGETTQKRGVVPDIVLPSITDRADFSEAKLDHVLDFDPSRPAKFQPAGDINSELIAQVRERSSQRRAKSEEFAKLVKHIARLHEFAAQTTLTFNEAKLKQYRAERKELAELARGEDPDRADPEERKDKKFGATTYEREVLAIVGDLVRLTAKR